MEVKEPKYKIGQTVYYALPESSPLLVVDAVFSVREQAWKYVAAGIDGAEKSYYGDELVETKIY